MIVIVVQDCKSILEEFITSKQLFIIIPVFFFPVTEPHSSICPHIFWHFCWTTKGHPKGCACNGHCHICLVVSGASPHSHVVSPLKYFHLFRCSMLHDTPMPNLLRHLHAVHGLVRPLLSFHPGWQRSCVMTSSAGVSIHCSGWLVQGSQQVVRS